MKKLYDFTNKLPLSRLSYAFAMVLVLFFLTSGSELNAQCTADAGTLVADTTPVQLAGGSVTISATEATAPTVPTDYEVMYVLTSGSSLVIEAASATPEFSVDTAGDYIIHTLIAEISDILSPDYLDLSIINFGSTTASDGIDYINSTNICADLDTTGAPITVEVCTADAGSLTADLDTVQLAGGSVMISATEDTGPTVPAGYDVVYVLTMGTDLTIMDIQTAPEFTVSTTGDFTIHTLVAKLNDMNDPNYLDASVITLGTTTGGDVIDIVTNNGLCASLLVAGAAVTVETCTADAGTLTADASPVQLAGDEVVISATEETAPTVPSDYEVLYVLTSGDTSVIEQTSDTPEFSVDTPGNYKIHTLVAETTNSSDDNYLNLNIIQYGVTTASQGLNYITSNGLCASLFVAGASIVVETCTADAGTLTADMDTVQLAGGSVMISATEATAPTVPTGYEVVYVLTMGTDLTIMDIQATPEFTVNSAGDYTIHTLVAELSDMDDPNYLDASVITFGTTTGVDVINIVTNNGLCASLLVAGAVVTVETCTADAGTLTADMDTVQLAGGSVMISATEATAPTVPTGYEVVYVLTMGTDLTIMDIQATPEFTVNSAGDYTIHTLVAELSDMDDPNYLDASVITFGTTTGVDVINIVTNNGLCASLLVAGAVVTVETCTANAGTLTADMDTVQLAGGSVMISATEATAPTVPTGYEVVYVLTMGTDLTIMDIQTTPEFTVNTAGDYTIHTLVAELSDMDDPNYLDASVITFGTTTGVDVINIVTNNGLCASLLVAGAVVTVETCTADAGTLTADMTPVNLNSEGNVMISATEATAPTIPEGYEVVYVLTMGTELTIMDIQATPEFTVTATGNYTIHTLVAELSDSADPYYLDASVIVLGTTTGGDVLNLVSTNNICAALDVNGAPIQVDEALGVNDAILEQSITLYPNPIAETLNIKNSRGFMIKSIELFDISGRSVKTILVENTLSTISTDMSHFNSGTYIAVIDSDKGQLKKLVVKK